MRPTPRSPRRGPVTRSTCGRADRHRRAGRPATDPTTPWLRVCRSRPRRDASASTAASPPAPGPLRRRPALPAPPRLRVDRRRAARRPRPSSHHLSARGPAVAAARSAGVRQEVVRMTRLRRRRRRRPGRRRRDRDAAGPRRPAGRGGRARPSGHRHRLHARPDAGRRAAALAVGPARRGRGAPARRRSGGPSSTTPACEPVTVTIRPARRRRRAVRTPPVRARPDPGRRGPGGRRGASCTGRVTELLRDDDGRVAGVP